MGFFYQIFSAIKSVVTFFLTPNNDSPQPNKSLNNYSSDRYTTYTSSNNYASLDDDKAIRHVAPTPPNQTSPTFLHMEKLAEYPMPMSILDLQRDDMSSPGSQGLLKYCDKFILSSNH